MHKKTKTIDRTSAPGLLRSAREFMDAALIVHERRGNVPFSPVYFLYGHAIELALKAFLRLHGYSMERIDEIGHNLESLVAEAHRFDLLTIIPMSSVHLEAISSLNPYYRGKELEYIDAGQKWHPSLPDLQSCCRTLVHRISLLCRKNRTLDGK